MTRLRILMTSVGSLVGQNLLDSLECRREAVTLVGVDANAENPRLFRCDKAYLVPPVSDRDAFRRRVLELIEAEQPDLVLTGRDHDAIEIGALCRERPALSSVFPYGSPEMSHMMQDKWESWEFTQANGLPFAESVLSGTPDAVEQCLDLAARHGFPLVSKPRLGFGSLGVRLLFGEDVVSRAAMLSGNVVQVFLSPPEDWSDFTVDSSSGIPLFTTYRDAGQYSCQTIIGPDGTFTPPFCMLNVMVNGKSERGEICEDADLHAVATQYADVVNRHGWRGPFNLQCRRAADGGFSGFEMNGRLTGSTSARAWIGYDEIGILVDRFVGPNRLPPHPIVPDGVVIRFPTSYGLGRAAVRHLREHGEWSAESAR